MTYFSKFDPSIDDSSVFMILPIETVSMTIVFPVASYYSKRVDGRL